MLRRSPTEGFIDATSAENVLETHAARLGLSSAHGGEKETVSVVRTMGEQRHGRASRGRRGEGEWGTWPVDGARVRSTRCKRTVFCQCVSPAPPYPTADEGVYIEFPRAPDSADGPFPLCWFRFDRVDANASPLPRGELRCELTRPRSLRYLLVRLIAPEDRMEVRAARWGGTLGLRICCMIGQR